MKVERGEDEDGGEEGSEGRQGQRRKWRDGEGMEGWRGVEVGKRMESGRVEWSGAKKRAEGKEGPTKPAKGKRREKKRKIKWTADGCEDDEPKIEENGHSGFGHCLLVFVLVEVAQVPSSRPEQQHPRLPTLSTLNSQPNQHSQKNGERVSKKKRKCVSFFLLLSVAAAVVVVVVVVG